MDSNNQFKCNNYKILNSIINREDIRTNELVPHPMGYISVDTCADDTGHKTGSYEDELQKQLRQAGLRPISWQEFRDGARA